MDQPLPHDPMWATFRRDHPEVTLVLLPDAAPRKPEAAAGLNVPQVWAGNSSRDVVAALADDGWVGSHTLFGAGLGNDVAENDFGANRFQAEDETRASWHRNFDDHVKYYNRGTESIFNMGQIMVGDYDEVISAEPVHDPWWGAPQDPEVDRTPTPTVPENGPYGIRERRT